MANDAAPPTVTLSVFAFDGDAAEKIVAEEGIAVHEVAEEPAAGILHLAWIIKLILDGTAWDAAKFVGKLGAKGLQRLVKKSRKRAGRGAENGAVQIQDHRNTVIILGADLPKAAYEALLEVAFGEHAGRTLSWTDGAWQSAPSP